MNSYLENLLYRGVAGYLIKIKNSPTAYINADEFGFDSDHGYRNSCCGWLVS